MLWFFVAAVVFLLLLYLVYRWAAGKAPRGAFRGRGRYGGAGVVEKFREDDPRFEEDSERG